jgi:hypothetical protein
LFRTEFANPYSCLEIIIIFLVGYFLTMRSLI